MLPPETQEAVDNFRHNVAAIYPQVNSVMDEASVAQLALGLLEQQLKQNDISHDQLLQNFGEGKRKHVSILQAALVSSIFALDAELKSLGEAMKKDAA